MKINHQKNRAIQIINNTLIGIYTVATVACGGSAVTTTATTSAASTDSVTSTSFPSQLMVSSPFDVTEASAATSNYLTVEGAAPSFVTHYEWATGEIDAILAGTSTAACTFDPTLFLKDDMDADCFGPNMPYEAHPDATSSSDPQYNGQLPSGDVGMWTETDTTGHACAAAQLNTKMETVRDRSLASLMGLASLVCVATANGYSMPSSSTLNLTADMSALSLSGVTFYDASITHTLDGAGNDQYAYRLDIVYNDGVNNYPIVVDMSHTPDATTSGAYAGQLSYLINDQFTGGNCPTSDITVNGSLQYIRTSSTEMWLEARDGQFCEAASDGRDSDNIVDPSQKYDATSNPTGWGNNFSIFTASYDPSSLDGNFAYNWQAGPNDGKSRTFNVNIDSGTGTQVGLSFFGYGDDIETTDGSIDGFICNWAGPNNSHTVIESAQYQEVSFDSATGFFVSDDADLAYAPTVSCDYDGSGSFIYDTNADGLLTDETHAAVSHDLHAGQDLDSDGSVTIEEVISATGFILP